MEMSLFPSIFCTISPFSLERTSYALSFRMNGVFSPCDHGRARFLASAHDVRIQSINKKIFKRRAAAVIIYDNSAIEPYNNKGL